MITFKLDKRIMYNGTSFVAAVASTILLSAEVKSNISV